MLGARCGLASLSGAYSEQLGARRIQGLMRMLLKPPLPPRDAEEKREREGES